MTRFLAGTSLYRLRLSGRSTAFERGSSTQPSSLLVESCDEELPLLGRLAEPDSLPVVVLLVRRRKWPRTLSGASSTPFDDDLLRTSTALRVRLCSSFFWRWWPSAPSPSSNSIREGRSTLFLSYCRRVLIFNSWRLHLVLLPLLLLNNSPRGTTSFFLAGPSPQPSFSSSLSRASSLRRVAPPWPPCLPRRRPFWSATAPALPSPPRGVDGDLRLDVFFRRQIL